MTKAAELAIGITTDASDAVAGFADVDRAADQMGKSIDQAGDTAAAASRNLGISADAADDMAGKTGKATGALGALAGGLEAVGLEKYAAGLQGAAIATDFASGAGDALNLVMESTILKNARAAVATAASTVATIASTVATKAMTAGQWALNAALNANPIGLVVLAVVALVGLMVLLYNKSTFVKGILDAVGRTGKAAIAGIVNAVQTAVGWVKDRLPGAFSIAKTLIVGYLALITLPIRTVYNIVSNLVTAAKSTLPTAFDTLKTKVGNIAEAITSPFKTLKGYIDDILDLIKKIKVPDLNPLNRTSGAAAAGAGRTTVVQTTPVTQNYYQFTITGALDPAAVAAQIKDLLYRYDRNFGRTVT